MFSVCVCVSAAPTNTSTPVPSSRDSVVGIATRYGAVRSGDRIPMAARFSAPAQTGPGAHPDFYTMGTGSISRK